MGCDIHLFVEKKVEDKWVSVDKWTLEKNDPEDGGDRLRVEYEDRFYTGRNYELFSILAGVRGDLKPIAEPRGIPEDSCDEIKAESKAWDGDGHSHSYFTVEELLNFDWTQTATLHGIVNALEFQKWNRYDRKHGEGPDSYCGGVYANNLRWVSMDEMEKIMGELDEFTRTTELGEEEKKAHIRKTVDGLYCRASWELSYYKMARSFLSDTIPKLLRLGKQSDVRIVFFFDN